MANILDNSKYRDRRQRDEMLRLSQRYHTSKKVIAQPHYKTVLKVGAGETRDHEVNYDAQLQK